MIGMNGFTLGFFFPKQDFLKSASEKQPPVERETTRDRKTPENGRQDNGEDFVPFLYAYRFF